MGLKETGRYTARTADGTVVDLVEYTQFHEGNTSSGSYSEAGTKQLRTADGDEVGRVSKGRYNAIIDGEEIELTSDDPAAP